MVGKGLTTQTSTRLLANQPAAKRHREKNYGQTSLRCVGRVLSGNNITDVTSEQGAPVSGDRLHTSWLPHSCTGKNWFTPILAACSHLLSLRPANKLMETFLRFLTRPHFSTIVSDLGPTVSKEGERVVQ